MRWHPLRHHIKTSIKLREISQNDGKAVVTGVLEEGDWRKLSLLQSIHTLNKYRPIVMFVKSFEDVKKQLISRKSRYSGLFGILEIRETTDLDASIEKEGDVAALISLNPKPSNILGLLRKAEALRIHRFLIAFDKTTEDFKIEELLKLQNHLNDALQNGSKGTIVFTEETTPTSDGGEALHVEELKIGATKSNDAKHGLISDADFHQLIIDCFRTKETEGKILKVKKGDSEFEAYLRSIRCRGLSRSEELAIQLNHPDRQMPKPPSSLLDTSQPDTKEEDHVHIEDIDALFSAQAELRLKKQQQQEKEAAVRLLSRQWRDRHSMSPGGDISEEEYLKKHWKRGIEEAKRLLQHTNSVTNV